MSALVCVVEFIVAAGRPDLSFLLLKYVLCIISYPINGVDFFNTFMETLASSGIEIDPHELLESCEETGLSSDAALINDQITVFLHSN